MTLLYRLFFTIAAFAIVSVIAVKWLYPKQPDYVGEYQTKNARGDYYLRVVDRETAVMIYTDKGGRKFAYRGKIARGSNDFSLTWVDQRNGEDWVALPAPAQSSFKWSPAGQITMAEGSFTRLPRK